MRSIGSMYVTTSAAPPPHSPSTDRNLINSDIWDPWGGTAAPPQTIPLSGQDGTQAVFAGAATRPVQNGWRVLYTTYPIRRHKPLRYPTISNTRFKSQVTS